MESPEGSEGAPSLRAWWRRERASTGVLSTLGRLSRASWEFLRESTPERRRRRYGDADFDWDYRVDTTSGTVGRRERFLGTLYSPYQATDPALFAEMMTSLAIDFQQFTFVDLGSGKGRTLLMASSYPFRRVVGIELLPALHAIAQENIRQYANSAQRCFSIESGCQDARDFVFPPEPIVLYLFNPLPEHGLKRVTENLRHSLEHSPRPVYVVYHNPLLENVLAGSRVLRKIGGTHQYVIYSSRG